MEWIKDLETKIFVKMKKLKSFILLLEMQNNMKNFRIKVFLSFFVLFLSEVVIGQNSVDSLYYYEGKRDFQKAIYFGEIVKGDLIKNHDEESLIVVSNNLGVYYYTLGYFQKAENQFKEALELQKNKHGVESFNFALIQKHASKNYRALGEFDKAEKFINNAISIFKNKAGVKSPDLANAIEILGQINVDKGNYKEAISLLEKSVENFKAIFGENDVYASVLGLLGNAYLMDGKYSKSEYYLIKSINILKKSNNVSVTDYVDIVGSLSQLLLGIGNYKEAARYLEESMEMVSKSSYNPRNYIKVCSNIGYYYLFISDYVNAEVFIKEGMNLGEEVYGSNNMGTLTLKFNLSTLYQTTGNLTEAEELNIQVLNSFREIKGEFSLACIVAEENLAQLYAKQKKYFEAEKIHIEVLDKLKKLGDGNEGVYFVTIKDLANMYDNYDLLKSSIYNQKQCEFLKKNIYHFLSFLSENELKFYSEFILFDRFYPLSFLHRNPQQFSSIKQGCYENELLVKNLSLRNQQRIASSIQKSKDEALKQKYEQFVSNKRQLTKWNELPQDKRPATYTTVNAEIEILEKELVRSSVEFADAKKALSINWKQIQDKLKANELAVDLVAFRYYNQKWTDSIVYAAFVVGKDFKAPKYIPLFEEKQLAFLLERNQKDNDASRIDRQYQEGSISDLFLKPLEKELKGISTIYLAPAGLGHQIDFSALPISVSQTLGEKYKVHVLGSTAQILSYNQEYFDKNDKIDLLLYGAVNYDKSEDTTKIDYVSNDDRPDDQFQQNATRCGIAKWSYLGGTKKEVEQIEIAARNNGFSTTIVNESNATEESIKKLDGRKAPFVLHLATHGFFFADPKQELQEENLLLENKYKVLKNADDPMMRSGLLFAGANKYWTKPTENLNTDDGILTASEISNLDLSACQLVVLSACETGLGEIKGSEGVFGLQRAFKMAGVKNIIMSLWKVPDAQTAELFEIFYSECLSGNTIHDSLKTAQEQMKQKYSPYYWAGFVLLE